MITVDTLKTLTSLGPKGLAALLANSGYSNGSFKTATFLGITTGGQFCYKVTYQDENTGGVATGKVFVTYDHATGSATADF